LLGGLRNRTTDEPKAEERTLEEIVDQQRSQGSEIRQLREAIEKTRVDVATLQGRSQVHTLFWALAGVVLSGAVGLCCYQWGRADTAIEKLVESRSREFPRTEYQVQAAQPEAEKIEPLETPEQPEDARATPTQPPASPPAAGRP